MTDRTYIMIYLATLLVLEAGAFIHDYVVGPMPRCIACEQWVQVP